MPAPSKHASLIPFLSCPLAQWVDPCTVPMEEKKKPPPAATAAAD